MAHTTIRKHDLILHNVNVEITESTILRFMVRCLSGFRPRIREGKIYYHNGQKCRKFYIILNTLKRVNNLMKCQPFQIQGYKVEATRDLPKTHRFYQLNCTGLKIIINPTEGDNQTLKKLHENDLIKTFQHFGKIDESVWANNDKTEALFTFANFDSVDAIILHDPSPTIKGINVNLEKALTAQDYKKCLQPFVIHVTDLPVRVTSKELSEHFEVPIQNILLYPSFWCETHLTNGRSSSEAWIKGIDDENAVRSLAERKSDTLLGKNKIKCEAVPDSIDENELCEQYQKGQCEYSASTCDFKHISCYEPDTCSDKDCRYGHCEQRKTISNNRPQFRSEDAQYRIKFSNLPAHITEDQLMQKLNMKPKFSNRLILQPTEQNSNSSKMAYLIRQPSENKLRRMVIKYHNESFSTSISQKIECQLELNQDIFEWNDEPETSQPFNNPHSTSPALSVHSNQICVTKSNSCHTSAASIPSCVQFPSSKSHIVEQPPSSESSLHTNKHVPKTIISNQVPSDREPPSDMTYPSDKWHWMKARILNDQSDKDELYLVQSQSKKKKYGVTKIYGPKKDPAALLRAQREQVALQRLQDTGNVPKLLGSNIDMSRNQTNETELDKELWNMMKIIDGEILSDYVRNKNLDLPEALQITRQLLDIVKKIHDQGIIHRDIQPKNILVRKSSNNDQINLTLMNFSSAWIKNCQTTCTTEKTNDPLGKCFYQMPQFVTTQNTDEHNNNKEQLNEWRRSPTIDTTGICAILFWLITQNKPLESKDISGKSPHQLTKNVKLIEKKLEKMKGFRKDLRTDRHLGEHLELIFDRSFAASPEDQWSILDLDYQLQFMVSLTETDKKEFDQFFIPQETNNSPSYLQIPLEDSFVYVVSLIHHLKSQFEIRHSKHVQWLTKEKSHWKSVNDQVENEDIFNFTYGEKSYSINIIWYVRKIKDEKFSIRIKAMTNDKIIELPLDFWEKTRQTNDFETYFNYFEIEVKHFIFIMYKK